MPRTYFSACLCMNASPFEIHSMKLYCPSLQIAEQHRRQFGPIRRNSEGNRQQPRALHQQDAPLSRASSVASIQSNANRPALSGPASLVRASSDTISSNAYRRADEVSPTERGSGLGAYPSGQRAPTLAPVRADLRSIREVESENDRDRERQRGRQGARERFGGRSPAVIAAAQIIEVFHVNVYNHCVLVYVHLTSSHLSFCMVMFLLVFCPLLMTLLPTFHHT